MLPTGKTLTHCMLDSFLCCLLIFFLNQIFPKIFQEYYQSVKNGLNPDQA